MNVLIIGNGGREHAIGWSISKSPKLQKLYFAPGNGGTSEFGKNINMDSSKHDVVMDFCKNREIDLVIIGPDEYLAQGITDSLENENIKVFGPTKGASRIEWSKEYAKKFMLENNIPTAKYRIFSDSSDAINKLCPKTKIPSGGKSKRFSAREGGYHC